MLEYRNQDRLYLPVENLEMLSKYNSNDENIILDRLGSDKWKIKKEKIKKDIMKLASELIDVAAKRKLAIGLFSFPRPERETRIASEIVSIA